MQISIPVAPKPPPQVRPANLTPQQQLSLRRSAIHRILANANTPSQETRIALLSRLATKSASGDGIGDEILQHMFRDYHTNQGHELAVTWLFALYKEHTAQTDNASSTSSASIGAGTVKEEASGEAQIAEKAETVAETAADAAEAESAAEAGNAEVKKSEGDEEAGPSAMDVDGLSGKPISCTLFCYRLTHLVQTCTDQV